MSTRRVARSVATLAVVALYVMAATGAPNTVRIAWACFARAETENGHGGTSTWRCCGSATLCDCASGRMDGCSNPPAYGRSEEHTSELQSP